MTKKLDVTVSNMIWASPADGKLLRKAREMYSIKSYNEKACSKCEFLPDRHTDECDDCPNFLANYELWKEKGDKIGVPRGDTEMAAEWLDGYKYKMRDKRIRIPFKHKIKMTVDLRDTQVPAVKAMLKKKNGQMESPPRSGKTVMTIVTAIERGQRTLILASQYDYLAQFYETLVGGPSNKAMTNIPKIEERLGRPICGIVNTPEQMKGLDIVLCTYQSFISKKGKKQLKKIKRLFGTVIIDEVQTASAPCFSSVINAMEAESRIGVSGTTERKDGLNCHLKGTTVLTETGTKKIEELRIGDTVLSYNTGKQRVEKRPVLDTFVNVPAPFVEIVHEHGTLRCTEGTEIWSVTRQQYVLAKDLTPDDELLIESVK